jgi:hypothetical protein
MEVPLPRWNYNDVDPMRWSPCQWRCFRALKSKFLLETLETAARHLLPTTGPSRCSQASFRSYRGRIRAQAAGHCPKLDCPTIGWIMVTALLEAHQSQGASIEGLRRSPNGAIVVIKRPRRHPRVQIPCPCSPPLTAGPQDLGPKAARCPRRWGRSGQILVGGPGFEPASRTLRISCPPVSCRFLQCPSVLNFDCRHVLLNPSVSSWFRECVTHL